MSCESTARFRRFAGLVAVVNGSLEAAVSGVSDVEQDRDLFRIHGTTNDIPISGGVFIMNFTALPSLSHRHVAVFESKASETFHDEKFNVFHIAQQICRNALDAATYTTGVPVTGTSRDGQYFGWRWNHDSN